MRAGSREEVGLLHAGRIGNGSTHGLVGHVNSVRIDGVFFG